jgi:hypothetical protein
MRYRLRTLLIVLALGPPLIALAWWYGKMALGLLLLTLLFCPDLFAGGGLLRDLATWIWKRNRQRASDDNRLTVRSE